MDLKRLIATANGSLDITTVIQSYSRSAINRAGFCRCPFHGGDRDPSLKVYPNTNSFYCFGCHKGGDPVRFTQLIFNESATDALKRLNDDFALGLTEGDLKPSERVTMNHKASTVLAATGRGTASQALQKAKLDALTKKCVELIEKRTEYEPLSEEWCKYQWLYEKAVAKIEMEREVNRR